MPLRMTATPLRALLLLTLVCTQTPTLQAQGSDESSLAEQIEEAISEMSSGNPGAVYSAATTLYEIGDTAIPALRAALEQVEDPWVLLGCLRALVELESTDSAAERLLDLAGPEQESQIRIAAMDVIARLPRERKLEEGLSDFLDRAYDPEIKVALAKTLYHVGDAAHRKRARSELQQLLRSEDRVFRVKGALALAEIRDFDRARPVLLEIENEPTLEGRLARSYLQNEKIIRYWENRETRRFREGNSEQVSGGDDRFEVLREIIDLVKKEHIYGERYEGEDGEEELLTAAAKGMLSSIDRHSTYFSADEYQKWLLDLQRNYAGIGAYVNTIGGFFTITRPIYSGPAYKVGLRSDDQILSVDGWETYNQPQQDVIDKLKSKPGTEVVVEVMRNGWREPKKFTIVRETINIPSVKWELFPGQIGYVEAETFGNTTHTELHTALDDLTHRGARAFILDLRYNPGGYLREAIKMVGEFVGPNQLVVYTEGRSGEADRRQYKTDPADHKREQPLVILVNHRSASASEIVAGALKFYGRAQLIGTKTFGKGSVQNPFPLESRKSEPFRDLNRNGIWDPDEEFSDENGDGKFNNSAMFKLTTQLYYLPDNRSIHTLVDGDGRVVKEGGVQPDQTIALELTAPWKEEELSSLGERRVFTDYLEQHFKSRHSAEKILEVLTQAASDKDLQKVLDDHDVGPLLYEHWKSLYNGMDLESLAAAKQRQDQEREANHSLFVELSEGDGFDTNKYPEFDSFYTSLDTHIDRNEIRRYIRLFLRARVADLRKKPFPGNNFLGDYQEDTQLQLAIVELLRTLGADAASIPQFARFADIEGKQPDPEAEQEEVRNDR